MAKRSGQAASKPKTNKNPKNSRPRKVKQAQYKSLRLQKRIKHPVKLPNVIKLTKMTVRTLWQHKLLLLGITLIYGLLNLILVQGFAGSTDVSELKAALDEIFIGNWAEIASSLSIFAVLVSSAGSSGQGASSGYQIFLALLGSLAIIWALRQVLAGSRPQIREAYYRGIYPLVPFILVLVVIGLQLIPLLVGSTLYSLVINNGVAIYFIEKLVWALLYGLLALLSLYMISSSLFALYIVTLPDMTPLQALRSARELVRHRRLTVLRKLLFLPLLLLVVGAVIMLPIIVWLTPLAQWIFFLLTMLSLLAIHGYMYTLYRELLNE